MSGIARVRNTGVSARRELTVDGALKFDRNSGVSARRELTVTTCKIS